MNLSVADMFKALGPTKSTERTRDSNRRYAERQSLRRAANAARQARQRNAPAARARQTAPAARQTAPAARQAARRNNSPKNIEVLQFLVKAKKNSHHNYPNLKRPAFLHISNWRIFEKFLSNSRKKYIAASKNAKLVISRKFIQNFKEKTAELNRKAAAGKRQFNSVRRA
jgi:hypothetical protein